MMTGPGVMTEMEVELPSRAASKAELTSAGLRVGSANGPASVLVPSGSSFDTATAILSRMALSMPTAGTV